MKHHFRDLSIRKKIIGMVVCICALNLVIAFAVYGYFSWQGAKNARYDSLRALSRSIAINSTAALAFHDPQSAGEILEALRNVPNILDARLFSADGEQLARLRNPLPLQQDRAGKDKLLALLGNGTDGFTQNTPNPTAATIHLHENHLDLLQPVTLEGRTLGYLLVQADTYQLRQIFERIVLGSVSIILVCLVIAYLLTDGLERIVFRPLNRLTALAARVSRDNDYHLRAAATGRDEIGRLVSTFNEMLDKIEERDLALEKLVADLDAAKQAAEAANRTKSEFLANISHEIRTPMHGVLGMAELMARHTEDPNQLHYLRKIQQSGKTLLHIINELLDLSKIEAGKLTLEQIPFHLPQVVDELTAVITPQAQEKGLVFTIEKTRDMPVWLLGDPLRLKQILFNLLGNAVKFTESGSVSLGITQTLEPDGRFTLSFSVSDTGIGIDPDKLEPIFEAFTQADGATTRKFGGTGLGLTVCRQLADLMGGTLEAHSTPGEGSRFRFSCSLAPSRENPPDGMDSFRAVVTPRVPGRVLVVEDNPINANLVEEVLLDMGLEVNMAANGKEALRACQTHCYDLVLMDIQMPVMDGFTAVRAIRQGVPDGGKTVPTVPIIALTAAMDPVRIEALRQAGCNDVLGKPFDLQQLGALIHRWIPAAGEPLHA